MVEVVLAYDAEVLHNYGVTKLNVTYRCTESRCLIS